MEKRREMRIEASPAVEGTCIRCGLGSAIAVRNRKNDITVRRVRRDSLFRETAARIPLFRGAARPFFCVSDLFASLKESEALSPQQAEKGTRFEAKTARLFRVPPETHSARLSAAVFLILTVLLTAVLPRLADTLLAGVDGLTDTAVSAIVLACTLAGLMIDIKLCSGLRVFRRICAYSAASTHVINAYAIYGHNITMEQIRKCSGYARFSDAAFLFYTAVVSLAAAAFLPVPEVIWLRVPIRAGIFLLAAALVDEPYRRLEQAHSRSLGAIVRDLVMRVQGLWLRKPDGSMYETALCAFEAIADELP